MNAKRVYLSGPMSGLPEFNFPAFHKYAAELRSKGYTVFSPAEKDNERFGKDISKGNLTGDPKQAVEEHGFSLREALAEDLAFICREADAIALMPGWDKSKGATAEYYVAIALNLDRFYL